jgi:hypothetical protein
MRLPPPPQARQVEMHADDAKHRVADLHFGKHRAARL